MYFPVYLYNFLDNMFLIIFFNNIRGENKVVQLKNELSVMGIFLWNVQIEH